MKEDAEEAIERCRRLARQMGAHEEIISDDAGPLWHFKAIAGGAIESCALLRAIPSSALTTLLKEV